MYRFRLLGRRQWTGDVSRASCAGHGDGHGWGVAAAHPGRTRSGCGREAQSARSHYRCPQYRRIAQGAQPPGGSRRQSLGGNDWDRAVSFPASPVDGLWKGRGPVRLSLSMPCFRIATAASGWAEICSTGSMGIGFICFPAWRTFARSPRQAMATCGSADLAGCIAGDRAC